MSELDLPEDTKVVFFYRDDQFNFVNEKTSLENGDEVVILTHSRNLPDLNERWAPKQTDKDD